MMFKITIWELLFIFALTVVVFRSTGHTTINAIGLALILIVVVKVHDWVVYTWLLKED